MSTDWDVWCLDCEEEHGFSNANYREEDMAALCRHADAVAGVAELFGELNFGEWSIGNSISHVRPEWFKKHKGHRLVPRDEYGRCLGECGVSVECRECGSLHRRCRLPFGHDGPHAPVRIV